MTESEGKIAVSVDFTPTLRRRIREACAAEGVTLRAWLTAAAEERLARPARAKGGK